jgi:hypothetical protein
MIVWLASYPRSGNSFFRNVCRTVYGMEVYSIYPEKKAYATADDLKRMADSNEMHLVKTHEMPQDTRPAIYLVRDGRDALVSLTWFNLANPDEPNPQIGKEQFQEALKKQILSKSYGGWSANVLAWSRRKEQTAILKFEELVSQPEQSIPRVLEELDFKNLASTGKSVPTFDRLHNSNPHLFRKGKVGGWKADMTDELHKLFWKKHGAAMDAIGYMRE